MLFSLSSYSLVSTTVNPLAQGTVGDEQFFGQRDSFSHTVLGESQTAWWCQYCKYAHQALQNIYNAGWYPFYYITLETSRNVHAMARAQELGYGGLPRVCFDGGYRVDLGAPNAPAAQNAYNISIRECGNRTVADIDLSISVIWLGSATIQVQASAVNKNIVDYHGRLRVYVTEIVSTMGWIDSAGYPYTFAFLDYAINTTVLVSAGESWNATVVWDGHEYNDGYGNSFGSITEENIMVIGALFNLETDFVDETASATPGAANSPPYEPTNPFPYNGSVNNDAILVLSWTGGDPDGDLCTYDVYFGENNPPPKVVGNQSSTIYNPGILVYESTYYWRIVAWDSQGASTEGPLWWFTIQPEPPAQNQPPYAPDNPYPPDDAIGVSVFVELSWTGGDPDPGDIVSYDVYFGLRDPPALVSHNQSATSYTPGRLDYNTDYYWRIVAWDQTGNSNTSDLWMFTTQRQTAALDIQFIRPIGGNIYLFDTQPIKRLQSYTPLVIGTLTIEAEVLRNTYDIEKIEFYINGGLRATATSPPYRFIWKERTFSGHRITAVAYDTMQNTASTQITIFKLF